MKGRSQWDQLGIGQVRSWYELEQAACSLQAHAGSARAARHGVVQELCDQQEEDVKKAVKEQDFWLMGKRRGKGDGTVAWKKGWCDMGMLRSVG